MGEESKVERLRRRRGKLVFIPTSEKMRSVGGKWILDRLEKGNVWNVCMERKPMRTAPQTLSRRSDSRNLMHATVREYPRIMIKQAGILWKGIE